MAPFRLKSLLKAVRFILFSDPYICPRHYKDNINSALENSRVVRTISEFSSKSIFNVVGPSTISFNINSCATLIRGLVNAGIALSE